MREISPAEGVSVDEYLALAPPALKKLVITIRTQKKLGKRRRPSASLVGASKSFSSAQRKQLLDKVAQLVDENWCGRSEMCVQFALLLAKALQHMNFNAKAISGESVYFAKDGRVLYRWNHAWVCVGDDIVDGNVDCLDENPSVPRNVRIKPYWGDFRDLPKDRQLDAHGGEIPPDIDVEKHWWPQLRVWLDLQLSSRR